ncbi:hypothetical protein [Bremerella cremea]|uniref:hypothetical protein n=1 Tax=Bremerella cremea TaxID=1031537 RepID=UPI0031EE2637
MKVRALSQGTHFFLWTAFNQKSPQRSIARSLLQKKSLGRSQLPAGRGRLRVRRRNGRHHHHQKQNPSHKKHHRQARPEVPRFGVDLGLGFLAIFGRLAFVHNNQLTPSFAFLSTNAPGS